MGIITKKILDRWSENIGLKIDKQIISWFKKGEKGITPYKIIRSKK